MKLSNLSSAEFEQIQSFLIEKSGLFFAADRAMVLENGLKKRMSAKKISSFAEYFNFLSSSEAELEKLIDLLTIGETYFFRNNYQFDALKETVLKELAEKKLLDSRKLKIWSAGCSTGEEAYTIAMVLLENLPMLESWEISIIATDINQEFLQMAKDGLYSKRSVAEAPKEYLEKYFTKEGHKYTLSPKIKNMVTFFRHNFATENFDDDRMRDVDILFCRNVIIYFNLETIKAAIKKFYNALADGGYLFLGYSETLWQINDDFNYIEFPHTFIYKKDPNAPKKPILQPFVPIPEFKLEEFIFAKQEAQKDMVEPIAAPKPPIEDIRPYIKTALDLANSGDYKKAIEELNKIVGIDNLCLECYYLMGVLKEKTGDLEKAAKEFGRVIYIDHTFALAYYNLANIYLFQKQYAKAKKEYQNTIRSLKEKSPEEIIPFTENFTVDLLLAACQQGIETCVN